MPLLHFEHQLLRPLLCLARIGLLPDVNIHSMLVWFAFFPSLDSHRYNPRPGCSILHLQGSKEWHKQYL